MEDYRETLRGLCPETIATEKVERAIHNWEGYMELMHLSGDDANKRFTEIIKSRLQDGIVSIASPDITEIEFYAFLYGRSE